MGKKTALQSGQETVLLEAPATYRYRKASKRPRMDKIVLLLIVYLFSFMPAHYGQNYLVYHERSTGSTGCGSLRYLSLLQPAPADTLHIGFKVQQQWAPTQAAIYYTTDGSNPSGSLGRGTGTTQTVAATLGCSNNGYLTAMGPVPPLPAGTVVKYIFSAWNGSGYEVFGNSELCGNCTPSTTSTTATQFTYSVQGVLPITFLNFTAKEGREVIRLYWASALESNMAYYEVYRSKNSLQFEKIGQVTALGNTSQRTDYFFDDPQPFFGNNYYRVTAVDQQGKSVSTSIQRVLYGKNDNSIVVFANPSSSLLNIRVVDIVKGEYAINVFENSGRLLYSDKIYHNGADGIYPVQLPRPLAKGHCHLVLTNKYQFYRSVFMVK
jgi:hypothetical protein